MKKINIILAFAVAFIATSCRDMGDYVSNPNDTENYMSALGSKQQATLEFENVWNAINTGYAFWDITDVDWDARYKEYKPKFEAFDEKINKVDFKALAKDSAAFAETQKTFNQEYKELYTGLVDGLRDGHMAVKVCYMSIDPEMLFCDIVVSPSNIYNKDRVHEGEEESNLEFYYNFILDYLKNNPNVSSFDGCRFLCNTMDAGHYTCTYTLPNGRKILYLWNSSFLQRSTIEAFRDGSTDAEDKIDAQKWLDVYDAYIDKLINTPKSELAGVILDLRADGGGELPSLKNYINIYTGEEKTYWETRYKEGMGRYDMSPWVPFIIGMPEKHRDLAAENIPLVCLCDVNSVSCAEVTTGSIRQLPTAHVIGERTWGGHGPLLGSTNDKYNLTYGGVAGDPSYNRAGFFIYTSNFENRPAGGPVLEGQGFTPDEEVLWKDKGYEGQFEAAINYINNHQ